MALASLVLGMGLPVTAAYIVLGTLSAPALYDLIVQGQLIDAIAVRRGLGAGPLHPDAGQPRVGRRASARP